MMMRVSAREGGRGGHGRRAQTEDSREFSADTACPISAGRGTRRVQLVRGEGRGVSSWYGVGHGAHRPSGRPGVRGRLALPTTASSRARAPHSPPPTITAWEKLTFNHDGGKLVRSGEVNDPFCIIFLILTIVFVRFGRRARDLVALGRRGVRDERPEVFEAVMVEVQRGHVREVRDLERDLPEK